ncbi:glutathione-regulated potassium-efflux system protein KefC [Salmonella enterica subsp. arizonae]|uniref:Glutathione-regulated potassium-efflux system protein KefC n=1 Tax=Salmonella enterica subsp. arizonae TaxID=59203 RepID=A0A379TGI0_SALER|nr:glutathione-regulated potassium-efflux system protein KefC [Salmonella enterica subsp. arizonae]
MISAVWPPAAPSTTLGAFALSALKVAGALALVVLLGRYVTRPALRFVARSGLREVFSAVALFLVFGFGLLLEEVGLSMAMGGVPGGRSAGEFGISSCAGKRY